MTRGKRVLKGGGGSNRSKRMAIVLDRGGGTLDGKYNLDSQLRLVEEEELML